MIAPPISHPTPATLGADAVPATPGGPPASTSGRAKETTLAAAFAGLVVALADAAPEATAGRGSIEQGPVGPGTLDLALLTGPETDGTAAPAGVPGHLPATGAKPPPTASPLTSSPIRLVDAGACLPGPPHAAARSPATVPSGQAALIPPDAQGQHAPDRPQLSPSGSQAEPSAAMRPPNAAASETSGVVEPLAPRTDGDDEMSLAPLRSIGESAAAPPARAAATPAMPSPHAPPPAGTPASTQVQVQITRAVHEQTDQIRVRLDPPDLGNVDIKLDFGDDNRVRAVVAVERSETLDLLQRDVASLERSLREAGIRADGGGLSFTLKRDQEQGTQGNQPGSSNTAPGAAEHDTAEPAAGHWRGLAARGLIDISA